MIMRSIAVRAAFCALLWWVLVGETQNAWGVGAAIIVLGVAVSMQLRSPGTHQFSIAQVPVFLAFFLWQSIKGGVQVAAMAVRPQMNLRPEMLEIALRLPEGDARMFLVSILNLLPGTLSVGLNNNQLLLHVLDAGMPIEKEVRAAEANVAALFRIKLSETGRTQ
jgi:multicomponent Na+:H+ antiporter subunit E